MLVKIENPNEKMPWIVIEQSAIVSVEPVFRNPEIATVTFSNGTHINIQTEKIEKIIKKRILPEASRQE